MEYKIIKRGSYSHHCMYSLSPKLLNSIAKRAVSDINETLVSKGKKVSIVFRGLSGSTIAGAMLSESDRCGVELGAFYVRKTSEESHGETIEYGTPWPASETEVFLLLDDFVDSGETLQEMYEAMSIKVEMLYRDEITFATKTEAAEIEWGLCLVEKMYNSSLLFNGFDLSFIKYRFGSYI